MIVVQSSAEFFDAQITRAMISMQTIIPVDSRVYLCHLLQAHTSTDIGARPVAFDMLAATQSEPSQRLRHFKTMGDRSLMIAGAWPASIPRSLNVSYYVRMGRMGYSSAAAVAATNAHHEHLAGLYTDLTRNFDKYVTLVQKVVGAVAAP